MATGSDVVVVGGGVIGLAIAWRAAGRGLTVTVVDPDVGHGASWAAAGMLAPVTEVHYGEEDLLQLNLSSARRYPTFVEELEEATGRSVGYRRSGTVMVARDVDDNAVLADVFAFQQKLGLRVERLRARECRELEPSLSPRVRGGVLVPDDHQVDNRALVAALVVACDRAGVVMRRERAREVVVSDGRVGGVVVETGEIVDGDRAVLAAGSSSSRLGGVPPVPVRPVKGQLLHLRGPADPLLATRNIRGLDVYLVPRNDGRLVVGATVEEQDYDERPTAGAVLDLLRAAYELLPGVTELEFAEVVVGLRPGTPDNAPLLGPAGVDGLVLATGHYRNGILLAPLTADGVAELLETGTTPSLLVPFSPCRFGGFVDGQGSGTS